MLKTYHLQKMAGSGWYRGGDRTRVVFARGTGERVLFTEIWDPSTGIWFGIPGWDRLTSPSQEWKQKQ